MNFRTFITNVLVEAAETLASEHDSAAEHYTVLDQENEDSSHSSAIEHHQDKAYEYTQVANKYKKVVLSFPFTLRATSPT